MKDIKNFLHLYLGCEVETVDGNGINLGHYYPGVWTRDGNTEPNGINVFFTEIKKVYVMNYVQCKLILRPLSSMTEEEADRIIAIRGLEGVTGYKWPNTFKAAAEATIYLLSKHFDLFSLIESGLAIDKNSSKEKI